MDAHGHVQITLEDPVDFVPPPRTGNDDTVERPRYGPLKSPQKRLMQESYPAEDTTPRRRSARLAQTSTPVRPLNLRITVPQVEEAVEETDMGHDVAEINQDAEDEPSQVLAERVLSAVSNPSPPPDFLSFPDVRTNTPPPPEPPESQTQSDNTSAAATPPIPQIGLSLNGEGVENAPADSANHTPTPHTLTFSSRPPGSPRQHALSAEKPPVPESSDDDTLDLPSLASTGVSSVDPLIRLQTDQGERAVTALEGAGGKIIDDETRDHIAELPILEESSTKPGGRRRSARRSASPVKRRSTSPDCNRLQPPPRRSARLSVSPRRTPSPDPTLVLPQISPLRLLTKNAPTLSDPFEIGVLPTVDSTDERLKEAQMAEVRDKAGRKRKRQDDANKAVGRQRLGSLSPDSQSVLQQLLPSSRLSSDEDGEATAATSQQPLFGPQRILVNRPPKLAESTHVQTIEPQPHLGTPLRRVLVSTSAIPMDGPNAYRFGQTLFKGQSSGDPNRTPLRRVPAVTRPTSNDKIVVPQPTAPLPQLSTFSPTLPLNPKPIVKQRSMSEEPTFSNQPSSGTNRRTALPYPLTQKHPIIPEEPEETQPPTLPISRALSEPPATLFGSTPRSALRQPTTPSRIPRIGTKPYSRPPAVQSSKLPVLTFTRRTEPTPSQTKPRNQAETSRGALSSEPKYEPFIPVPSRKTVGSSSETPSKPPVKRPIPSKRTPHLPVVIEKPPPSQIPIKSPPLPRPLALPDLHTSTDPATRTEPTKFEQGKTETLDQSLAPPEDQVTPEISSTSTRLRSRDISKEEEDTSMKRRTTRSRRGPSALLEEATFYAAGASPSRPPPKKRPPPDSSGFAGLSITALKNLTTDNTAKNQKVLSLLETEVVKREGKRPESPAVKLRTIAEKAMEEKAKQREERVRRRSKRIDSEELEPPDVGDLTLEEDGRYRRGAGEDEDYTTPERPMRSANRFEPDGSGEAEVTTKERRVQWDRLLFTTVFIDEIPEKRSRTPDQKFGKGCLSQTAKSTELDHLGNIQDAGLPLPQLPAEKVVVKRYVYDDDPPPEPEGSEEPENPPVRNTRSRGRKK